jgi:polysaccharide biosynthesis transport protein
MSDLLNLDRTQEPVPRVRIELPAEARPQGAPAPPRIEPPAGREVHLLDYVRVLYKRRWLAGAAFIIVAVAAAVSSFTTIPIFQAKTQVLIEKENTNVVTFKQAIEQNQTTDDYYQTQYKMLQSRALARRTIDALKLWDHPLLNPRPDASWSAGRAVMAPIGLVSRWIRNTPPPAAGDVPSADETKKQSAIIDRFLSGLTVVPVRNSRLVDVKYSSTSPAFSANVANAHSKAFIEQNLEFKFLSSKEASDWLGERLAEQRKQVDASEHALQQYREQNNAIALDDRQDIVVQKLSDLNAAVTRAKTERIEKEALYRQIQTIQNDKSALDTFPAILANPFIQGLKTELAGLQRQLAELSDRLGDKHPDIVKLRSSIQMAEAKLQGEVGKVVQSVRNQYLAAQSQENSLTEALNQQKGEALAMNRKGIEYGVLARDAASNRQIFESLMQRTKETGISGELKTNNIRIVDAAETPRIPINVNRRNDLTLGLFGGAALGICLAFFFEYLDNRIKLPEEMKQHLGLPFLGMVPALFGKENPSPLISKGVPPNFLESFRGLRTNLLFSSAESGPRSIVVTSTGPGEGKTLVAANLAVALAQAGPRVLLIDADMRKPRVHTVFERPQEPGLSNVLVGTAKASAAVRRTTLPSLWVMTAGMTPPNPAELLGSQRFKDFLASLGQHFEWVIIDTPPVMAVTDASVAAHVATGVLFVVGAQLTSRHTARRAIEQLQYARANLLGGVLNRVDLQHHGYYYSTYYRRDYADYYQKGPAA